MQSEWAMKAKRKKLELYKQTETEDHHKLNAQTTRHVTATQQPKGESLQAT